jgi:hypothetical protein
MTGKQTGNRMLRKECLEFSKGASRCFGQYFNHQKT